MKKILFMLAVLCYGFHAQAEIHFKFDTLKTDSAKVNKQTTKLKLKLADLNAQLVNAQNKLPIDSAALSAMLQRSHDAQEKSKKKSEQAVGGSVSDAKQAERDAKDAAKQTQKTEEGTKQVEKDRKNIKDLTKDIEKKQKELSKLQGDTN